MDKKQPQMRADVREHPTQFGVDDYMELEVESKDVKLDKGYIVADYVYQKNVVAVNGSVVKVFPRSHKYTFRTNKQVAKTGVMLVGWAGNNGSTMTVFFISVTFE